MLDNLSLLIVESAVGIVVLQTLAVAVRSLIPPVIVLFVASDATKPATVLYFQDIVVLYSVSDTYLTLFDINLDHWCDTHHIAIERACMVGNGIDGR